MSGRRVREEEISGKTVGSGEENLEKNIVEQLFYLEGKMVKIFSIPGKKYLIICYCWY
ncbi:hypothetical protein GCM10007103_19130 [Salinimicrobium marinum]|uniref:Uncharacterized protein n=1 Tax=Salinimicrobium marinum TaxID=680283 RepID=A0A918SGB1_9FLAO|nr:hypothetical protein [Salinimicrobium marinum]GHA37776.1 hypothetical protein GCM10007103_19130 [Salinimicrobium marinum]